MYRFCLPSISGLVGFVAVGSVAVGSVVGGIVGCGGEVKTEVVQELPPMDSRQKSLSEEFLLLNNEGIEAPAYIPGTKSAPFGVLAFTPAEGNVRVCSTTHLYPSVIVANAHCVGENPAPKDFIVVFYDRTGKRTYDRVQKIEYVGNQEKADFALFKLNTADETTWDVVNPKYVPTGQEVGMAEAPAHLVNVWSFDPIAKNHPQLYKKYGRDGGVFMPRTCLASRKRPKISGVKMDENGQVVGEGTFNIGTGEPEMHLFVDHCDRDPVHGNSGSLISLVGAPHRALGVYHWNVIPIQGAVPGVSAIVYQGNDKRREELSIVEAIGHLFYGVGTSFQYLTTIEKMASRM